MVGLLLVFWALFQAGQGWASVGVYFFRLILGLLLISQFWILANDIYDPRQAKRLFGFIGGGASLGGLTASVLVTQSVERVGTNNLLLVSAVVTGMTHFRGSSPITRLWSCMMTPIRTPATSSTYGKLSAPRSEMNFAVASGFTML